ncbi:ABC transporter ATP-binding protein, partial [Streptomyces sp. T-3]|nr:ABC transporter ATP-binding protein [Streptomyces sp. T-3]
LATGPRATTRFGDGDLVARLVGNAAQAGTAPAALASLAAAVLTPVGGLIALVLTDWRTAVATVVGMPVLALLLRAFVRASGESSERYLTAQGQIASRLVEAVHGARTIAAAGTQEREADRILAPLPELSRQGMRMWHLQGRSTAQAAALLPLLQLIALAVAGLGVVDGRLGVGGLFTAWRYAVLATGVGVLVGQLNGLVRARKAAARLAEVTAERTVLYGDAELPAGAGEVEFRGIRVERGERVVLDIPDLRLPGGGVTAVVGRSGSGKSLLAAVAGRLAEPDEGVVLLDGAPLTSLSHRALRRAVTHAFARPALLGASVGDTIAFGAYDPGESRVVQAARTARAHEFIRRLPEGYATACATAPLSGGEAQRLGLARAFAHPGRLLILDDATSGLDSATELHVTRALLHDLPGRARLVVAHRTSTAARADTVVWLEEGRVRGMGRHAELWQNAGYREVFADA